MVKSWMTQSYVVRPVDVLIAFRMGIMFAGFVFYLVRCGHIFNIFCSKWVFPHFFRTNCGLTKCYVVELVDFLVAFWMSLRFARFVFYLVWCGHFFNIFCRVWVFTRFFSIKRWMTESYVVEPVDFLIAFRKSVRFARFVFYLVRCGHFFYIFCRVGVFTRFFWIKRWMTEFYVVEPVDFLIAFLMSIRFAGFVFYLVRCGHFFSIFCSVWVFTRFFRMKRWMTEFYVVEPVDVLIAFRKSVRFAGFVFYMVRCGNFTIFFAVYEFLRDFFG